MSEDVVARVVLDAAALELTLHAALANPALRVEYDRLAGTNLCRRGAPLNMAVDDATGRTDAELHGFLAFAKDVLWDRAPESTRAAMRAQVQNGSTEVPDETVSP